MIFSAERLSDLRVDETTIRLDCATEWLEHNAPRLAIGGIHLATQKDMEELGFKEGAVVPDIPRQLTKANVQLLAPFCADDKTPASLCIGFGTLPNAEAIARRAIDEAATPGFRPHYGSTYMLGSFEARLVDALHSRPHTRTTIVQDDRIEHAFERVTTGAVGLHFDNAFTTEDGKERNVERFPRSTRAQLACRRLLYNTGPGQRTSIVGLNMSALHIADMSHPGDGFYVPNTVGLREYLASRPDEVERATYLAITLKVGEMMLLPAGNAMHDGSMEGCDMESTAVIFAGRFPRHAFEDAPATNISGAAIERSY